MLAIPIRWPTDWQAPEAVKLMVNRIDMSALADLYKVTKDRRI